jgi:hypothetical protein
VGVGPAENQNPQAEACATKTGITRFLAGPSNKSSSEFLENSDGIVRVLF